MHDACIDREYNFWRLFYILLVRQMKELLIFIVFMQTDSTDENEESDNTKDNNTPNIKQHIYYSSISDLLLWAIFANRKELAEICWLRGSDHLREFFFLIFFFNSFCVFIICVLDIKLVYLQKCSNFLKKHVVNHTLLEKKNILKIV